jgi:hypothetical protein
MAHSAFGFAKEYFLAAEFRLGGFALIELAVDIEFGCRWKIEQLLKFGHEVDLAPTLENVHAFLGRNDRITIEIRSALLELREIFNTLQRSLRPEQSLDVHASQTRSIQTVAKFLRSYIPNQMRPRISMPVRMAIEAGHSPVWLFGPTIFGCVELLLRKWGKEETKALQLFRIQNAIEHFEVVLNG